MKSRPRTALTLFLSASLALSTLPALALAQMGEEAMGEERIETKAETSGEPTKELVVEEDSLQVQSNELVEEQSPSTSAVNDELVAEGEDGLVPFVGTAAGQVPPEPSTNNVNCKFTLDSNGILVVSPEKGTSCVFCSIPSSVLLQYIDSMKGLRFEKGVKAHEDFSPFIVCCDPVLVDDGNGGEKAVVIQPYLESCDFTNLDFSAMRSTRGAFAGLRTPEDKLSLSLDTSRVTDMSFMFFGFQGSLHHKQYNTNNVTSMQSMFSSSAFIYLTTDFSNTANVTNMDYMFGNMQSLKSLDISCMSNAKANCNNMFAYTKGINKIVVGKGWDASKPGAFPESSSGKWWSAGEKKWMTNQEIASQRRNVADTYTTYRGFPDLDPSAWYLGVVTQATDLGFFSGYGNGNFGPNDKVTRGQVAAIMWNMAGKPAAGKGVKSFPDVASGKFYYDAVRWASSVGVVSGYANGKFGPEDNVTREQLAVMLANYSSKVAQKQASGSASDFSSMSDASKVSKWAAPSVGWCFKNGILSGKGGGRVDPQGNATRAESSKMVVYLHDMLA